MKKKPPNDTFMGMLDCAWDDFKTYREEGDTSTPLGLAIVLIGIDGEGDMVLKTGANLHPEYVQSALVHLIHGFATRTLEMRQVPPIRKRRVV